jgi:hypothetical protein
MARYSAKAQSEVKKAVSKTKRGKQRSGKKSKAKNPQTGDRDRALQGAEEGRQSAAQEEEVEEKELRCYHSG